MKLGLGFHRRMLAPENCRFAKQAGATHIVTHMSDSYADTDDLSTATDSGLEFCLGTLAEMTEGDIYETVDHYSARGNICYLDCRNVWEKVPNYQEVFIDEGDIDILRVLRIFEKNELDGAIIPDHTPQMDCDAPCHAGMAHALGYLRSAIQAI